MLTFKQFINENLESYFKRYPPYKITGRFDGVDVLILKFITDNDNEYLIYFVDDISKKIWDDESDYWKSAIEIAFKRKDYGYGIYPVNDQVEAIRIFTTVLNEIIKYDRVNEPSLYTLSSVEKSRTKLYDTFLPMLAKMINLTIYKVGISTYYMVRNDILEEFEREYSDAVKLQ